MGLIQFVIISIEMLEVLRINHGIWLGGSVKIPFIQATAHALRDPSYDCKVLPAC